MTIGRICSRQVDTAEPDETIHAAAQRMANRGVGSLVVVDPEGRPVGILTDRDVALRVVGAGRDPENTIVEDVMTAGVHTAGEDTRIEDGLAQMRSRTIRRVVVVRPDERLAGLLSLDDVLSLLAEELREVGALLEREDPRRVASR